MNGISRRRFIKTVGTGAVITAFPQILLRKAQAAWSRGTIVHPNIDNLRVVGITDSRMTESHEQIPGWQEKERLVNTEIVWENIDKLACSLAEEKNPKEAWKKVFIKPPGKSWPDTVVAIKTNNIMFHKIRDAVMVKICQTLINVLGMTPYNIHIYDEGAPSKFYPKSFAGLPTGCQVEKDWGGIAPNETTVPEPWTGRKTYCLKHLTDGSVDILVNIALSNRHWPRLGGFTMTMKNHFGTFDPSPGHREGSLEYLLAINQTPEILGPVDSRTGKVIYPRQQLCFVDALWSSKLGPTNAQTDQTNFLAMGVFSPVVDYLVANKFRAEKMGWEVNKEATKRMLTDFGLAVGDLPGGGNLIEV